MTKVDNSLSFEMNFTFSIENHLYGVKYAGQVSVSLKGLNIACTELKYDSTIRLGYRHELYKYTIMKLIQFALSILLAACAIGMLYGAITTPSPLKTMSVTITSLMCAGCIVLMRLSYKELVES